MSIDPATTSAKLLHKYLHTDELIQTRGTLFELVQKCGIFPDSKTFVDSYPINNTPREITHKFDEKLKEFLKQFVEEHFALPNKETSDFVFSTSNQSPSATTSIANDVQRLKEYIHSLWDHLTRQVEEEDSEFSTLFRLKESYVVPGGRFREIYYWDSYFTVEGLAISGRLDLIEHIIHNFCDMLRKIGHIPNGNRLYYLSRSQPPFFCSILQAYERVKKQQDPEYVIPSEYVECLEIEHQFWMAGQTSLTTTTNTSHNDDQLVSVATAADRVVALPYNDGSGDIAVLNRFWDDNPQPREESYREDIHLYHQATEEQRKDLYRNIRAAAESGMDFSSRWCRDPSNLMSIMTTELVPVDLNCLLWNVENALARWSQNPEKSAHFQKLADARKRAIHHFFWDEELQYFFDFNLKEGKRNTASWTIAGIFPLYFQLATEEQAKSCADNVKNKFVRIGGVLSALHSNESVHQWDAPNGWPPHQFIAVVGLANYKHSQLAEEIAHRWLDVVLAGFKRTGRIKEKYNVCDDTVEAKGGEYPCQDGFGWTNGVVLSFLSSFEENYIQSRVSNSAI